MDSGQIGRVYGDFEEIETSSFPKIRHERGNELKSTITISDRVENLSGTEIILGTAAEQIQSEVEKESIDEGGRVVRSEPRLEVDTLSTQFAAVPGEFVVIESSKQKFAFDLIGQAVEASIQPMTINLDELAADFHEDADFWMSGFYQHSGEAEKGIAYGDNVFDDNELGNPVWNSKKNQLGMDFEFNTDSLRMRITESGYVQVYGSDEFETLSLLRLINDMLLNYESQRGGE